MDSFIVDAHDFFVILLELKKSLDSIAISKVSLDEKMPYHRASREVAELRRELMKHYSVIDEAITKAEGG